MHESYESSPVYGVPDTHHVHINNQQTKILYLPHDHIHIPKLSAAVIAS